MVKNYVKFKLRFGSNKYFDLYRYRKIKKKITFNQIEKTKDYKNFKMKDIKSFSKLFGLNIPVYDHFDYYIEQLSKTQKFKDIKSMIPLFEKAEDDIGDIYQYKINKSKEIIEFLKQTRTYEEFNYDNLLPDLPSTKNFKYDEGVKYLSIDLKKANWQSIKKYDPYFLNELGDSYFDFLSKFDIPEVLMYSKQFRQFIFGNINPKRQIKVQRSIIQTVIDSIDIEPVCIKHDEVIYSYQSINDILNILSKFINDDNFNVKLFHIDRVEDFRIDNLLDLNNKVVGKDMVGCNGNLYYINLKKYITNEELDIKDLYFRMEGRTALWVNDNLKASL